MDFMDPLIVAEKIAVTNRDRIVTSLDISKELGDSGKRVRRKIRKREKIEL
ncbi:MAG: hypothetical protein HFJ54_05515 [Clostridia bacterium]|nr:hypothetical protein [Clostridia bacterium]